VVYIGIHVNPLKKRIVLVENPESGDYVKTEEPMSWEDAAKISLVIMLAQIFMVFLPKYDWSKVSVEFASFLFDLFTFAGGSFFAAFIALTGLARYFSK